MRVLQVRRRPDLGEKPIGTQHRAELGVERGDPATLAWSRKDAESGVDSEVGLSDTSRGSRRAQTSG
jgi:hypothetical protein